MTTTNRVYINFDNSVRYWSLLSYGKLPRGLHYNIVDNRIIGIYYNKKYETQLRPEIIGLLDYLDQGVPRHLYLWGSRILNEN